MNDESTSSSTDRSNPDTITRWDTRLHQLFALFVLAYLASTWVAPEDVSLAIASVLYVVVAPLLVVFYAVAGEASDVPVPAPIIGVILLSASLLWGFFEFVTNSPGLAEIAPVTLLLVSFALMTWNTADLNFK